MGADEEYLDNLLKSMMENEQKSKIAADDIEDTITEEAGAEENAQAQSYVLGEMLERIPDFAIEEDGEEEPAFAIEESGEEEPAFAIEENGEEEPAFAIEESGEEEPAFAIEENGEEEPAFAIEESGEEESDFAVEDFGDEEAQSEDGNENASLSDINAMSLEEIDAMFAAADAAANAEKYETNSNVLDEELAEINGLLHSDNDSVMEDDMMALLESISDESEAEDVEQAEQVTENIIEDNPEQENVSGKKKKGKKKKSFFQKKKKVSDAETAEKTVEGAAEDIINETDLSVDDFLINMVDEEEPENIKKIKKPNFFFKLLSFLTETDNEEEETSKKEESTEAAGPEISDENKDIMEELEEEDKKKKKKKVKGKKTEEEESDDEDGEESPKKGKKKKKKKEKNIDVPIEDKKTSKKISKKNIAVIAGLCITIAVIIVVLSTVVPAFLDKRVARDAYYEADYTKSYVLLYGKKLDNSDTIIFNKSKIILEMKRKLDSYHNYQSMGKEVQALDALLSGIAKYPKILEEAEEYHVSEEVKTIHETILNILNDKYNISEDVAKVIIGYEDDIVYTRKLESLIFGTPFYFPGEEAEMNASEAVSDMLQEEQQMLDEIDILEGTNEERDVEQVPEVSVENAEQTLIEELPVSAPEEEPVQPAVTNDVPGVSLEESVQPSAGQGQMIQGIRQPLDVQIHGN